MVRNFPHMTEIMMWALEAVRRGLKEHGGIVAVIVPI